MKAYFYKAIGLSLKLFVGLMSFFFGIKRTHDSVLKIKSRDAKRTIKVHVYNSTLHDNNNNNGSKKPILFNMHGGGFIFPLHGVDDSYCRQMANNTHYTVFDIKYRLAPQSQFPSPVDDVQDVVNYVLENHEEEYDLDHLAISGFSAGGNLAFSIAIQNQPNIFQSLISFYPVTDLQTDPYVKPAAPDEGGRIMPPFVKTVFNVCYLRDPAKDGADPRASPLLADSTIEYPKNVVMITCSYDGLCLEGEQLAEKIQHEQGDHSERTNVIVKRFDKINHAWDKRAKPGSYEELCRDEAYQLAQDALNI